HARHLPITRHAERSGHVLHGTEEMGWSRLHAVCSSGDPGYGRLEMILRISSRGNARMVRVRTFPRDPVASVSRAMVSSFGASPITTRSYSPITRYTSLICPPAALT